MSTVWYFKGSRMGIAPRPKRTPPFEKSPNRRTTPYRARGRVWKVGNTWHFEVTVNGKVVDSDNTGHWRTIFDAANGSVYAFDHVLLVGHVIKRSFAELVDRTAS